MSANTSPSNPPNDEKQGHVAVVYVHGMGNQRRHEEVSRLIDSIDIYLSNAFRIRGEAKGYLTKIRSRLEPSRNDPDRNETYIRAIHHFPEDKDWSNTTTARFFEVYWAPIMARHSSARRVLVWLFSQIRRPYQTIRARWRERQRLRRSILVDRFEHPGKLPKGVERKDIASLVELYSSFEGPTAQRAFPEGTFEEFIEFLKKKINKHPDRLKRCMALARFWHRQYWYREAKNAFLLITLGLTMLLLVGIVTGLILLILQFVSDWQALAPLL